jgi:hypothetical protein
VRWLLSLTLPGRTPTRTYICTLKCTFKGAEPDPSTHRTRPYGPPSHSTRAAACTFKCTFKGSCFEVVPQVRLVMWPRRSHSSLRRTHRLAWNPVQYLNLCLASNFQTFQIIILIIIIWQLTQLPYNSTYKYTYNLHYNAVTLVGGGYFCTICAQI